MSKKKREGPAEEDLDDLIKQEAKRVMTVADFFKRAAPAVAIKEVKAEPISTKVPTISVKAEPVSSKVPISSVKAEPVSSKVPISSVKAEPVTTNVHTSSVKAEPPSVHGVRALEGKTVVFSGNLSIEREKAIDLAVANGAKVTTGVSGKTTYLVLGSVLEDGRAVEEGSKYKKMKQLQSEGKPGPSMLTENEFFQIIGQSSQQAISTEAHAEPLVGHITPNSTVSPLWVDKYEPTSLKEYVGNSSTVKKVVEWIAKWKNPSSKPSGGYKPSNFPGRGGNTEAKAILLSGPPGIGKTLLARLACAQLGFQAVEFNASDYRSKSAVELISATLSGAAFTFSYSSSDKHPKGLVGLAHQCIIMDECDGMSAGDRGGNQALMQMIKKTHIPVICICNDRMNAKVRNLANHCYDLKMTRPTRSEVIARARQILASEKMLDLVPASVVEQIVDGSDCDIRQVINQLEGDSFDWKSTVQSYERKDRSTMLNGFEACRLILAPKPGMTVADRLDMFFVDYDLIPLMIQQNYVKCFQPGEIRQMKKSASLISYGDVISRNIRAEQNWTLLSEFGLIGNVFVPPRMEAGMSPYPDFPMWLGKYSTSRKSARIAQELQCVVSSASSITSRNIIKSNYAHVLYVHFVTELIKAARDASSSHQVDLPTLDRFGVSKNDLLELLTELLLPTQPDIYAEKVDTKTKAAITRLCNAHHMALKSGGAHFRQLKSVGGGALSLAVGDERGDVKVESGLVSEGEDGESAKPSKKETDVLVKASTAKKAAAKKPRTSKKS